MSNEIINGFQKIIIKAATENGVSLETEFGTKENFKQFVISFSIKKVVEILNCEVKTAYDLVLGTGEYDKMASNVWEMLNEKS